MANNVSDHSLLALENETGRRAATLNEVSKLLDTIELIIVCFGLVANVLGSWALLKSRHMSTPSFVYHKALGLTNLTYCLNFIVVKTLRQWTSGGEHGQHTFGTYAIAFYMGIVSRFAASTCGYFVMYMSLLIILDRFLALIFYTKYYRFNRLGMAVRLVSISLVLSSLGHSWAPWIENEIRTRVVQTVVFEEDVKNNSQHFDNNDEDDGANGTMMTSSDYRLINMTVYSIRARDRGRSLSTAISIKDMCNLVIRLTYALAQTVLTICVIRAFHSQNRKRRQLRSISPASRCNNTNNLIATAATNTRRERSLSCLMLAVAVLSCTQVLPREFKRIFDLIYPMDEILLMIHDDTLEIETRRWHMLLAVYGHGYWKLIANLLTALERSILFYLYFVFNHHFRREVLSPFYRLRAWIRGDSGIGVVIVEDTMTAGYGSPRRRSLASPSAKTSTNTLLSKISTHTLGNNNTDGPNLSSALWINRRLSSCVMLLYVDNISPKGSSKDIAQV